MIINTHSTQKGDIFPSAITRTEQNGSDFLFYTDNDVILHVCALTDSIIRFRYTSKGYFSDDFSYAIDLTQSHGYQSLFFNEYEDRFEIKTAKLKCVIEKKNCKKTIFDTEGNNLLEDELGFHWEESFEYGGKIVKMTKVAKQGESFFGMGDKASNLNLIGKRVDNWATDQYAFHKDQEPLYKAIPFYIGLHKNISYGIFFDNTFRSFFDFASERANAVSFWANGGEMNYYFIYGPEMQNVVVSYTQITGAPELPPLWALGYQQSKWSYSTEQVFTNIGKNFRELEIPCDALYLDIDYMDGFRCFTWNKENFPDPKKMTKELLSKGFKTVVIIDPGIKKDPSYPIFQEGLKEDVFCKRADGPYMNGKVWPGECFFPDFTNPTVRKWWAGLFKELVGDTGIRGIWTDMNEPAIMETPDKTFPLDVRHDFDNHPCSHRKAHNIYGMQMARASYEGIKQFSYPKRPFCVTRASYAGAQRYTATWTGDNVASWEHLWIANIQMQRLSMSGFSFCGSDIGGFAEHPSPELYARWIQLGAFHPFFRTHSSGQHGEQEPWSFGKEVTDLAKKIIELRYQLLPYMYTAFWHYIVDKEPILKSIVMFDQEDPQTHFRNDEFLCGDHLLVCPIVTPNATGRRMYLPKGKWYNYWTNEAKEGREEIYVDAPLDRIPLFIKEGAIIPKYPIQQYVDEKTFDAITLDVYYKQGKEQSTLFEDAHDGYDYQKGAFLLSSFSLMGNQNNLVIFQHQQGSYKAPYRFFNLNFIGLPFEIETVEIDTEPIALKDIIDKETGIIRVSQCFSEIKIFAKK